MRKGEWNGQEDRVRYGKIGRMKEKEEGWNGQKRQGDRPWSGRKNEDGTREEEGG